MLLSLFAATAFVAGPVPQSEPAPCRERYGERACTTPAFVPLRAEMAQKFAAVLAIGNRTATWQARHDAVIADIKSGLDYDGKRRSDEAFAQIFRDHIADLDKALVQAKGVRPLVKAPSGGGETCMATWLDQGCRVTSSGILWGRAGQSIYWQMMDGASGDDGVGAGIVLWAGSGYGAAKLIGWSFDGVTYDPPRLTQDGLIWVPGRIAGTGNGNADLLFKWDDASKSWQDIELESWWRTLEPKLPKGFMIWKGVDYDFEGMSATSKLWRERDANCCPSGGEALLDFDIAGRSLRLENVRVDIVEKWRVKQ